MPGLGPERGRGVRVPKEPSSPRPPFQYQNLQRVLSYRCPLPTPILLKDIYLIF
jgi:hypothetical protein